MWPYFNVPLKGHMRQVWLYFTDGRGCRGRDLMAVGFITIYANSFLSHKKTQKSIKTIFYFCKYVQYSQRHLFYFIYLLPSTSCVMLSYILNTSKKFWRYIKQNKCYIDIIKMNDTFIRVRGRVLLFNATFNNISVIS